MRVLFVAGRPPLPVRRGDQARTAALAEGLGRRGHAVRILFQRPPGILATGLPEGVEGRELPLARSRIAASLALRPDLPLQVAWHFQPAFGAAVAAEVAAFRPEVAVVVLSRLAWTLPALRGVPTLLDLVDSLALNMRRRGERQGLLGPLWRLEARRMERWDRDAIARAGMATVVAEADRRSLVAAGADPEKLVVVPLAIPLGPASPRAAASRVVLVSGNLGYFPTVDGLRWLVEEVWPRALATTPSAALWIAGSRPARAVVRLSRRAGVRLFADPADLDALRRQAAVAAVPLRGGSGTPMKALEAMAAGLPVVTTPAAVAGLAGLPSEAVALGEDAATFAAALLALLADPARAARQASAARAWVAERHDPERVTAAFERLFEGLARGGGDG